MQTRAFPAFSITAFVFALPLLGAAMTGRPLQSFFYFPPPLEIPNSYLKFSWLAAAAVSLGILALALPWVARVARRPAPSGARSAVYRFPLWGWGALMWTLAWWLLAWTRFAWFAPWQKYTFFPLWLGFIVFVNAAIQRRTGLCPMRRETRAWLLLFVVSAACWWGFEGLNRFVRNWHYLNVEDFSPATYALHATLCFSTVLPAVSAIAEWLQSDDRWAAVTRDGPRWPWLARRSTAHALLLGAILGLLATGLLPTWFYPAVWVAPLALAIAAEIFLGRSGIARAVAAGDWCNAAAWMIAALICGVFWEMWNWHSLAKWIYTVPGVERWFVFEMPLLGYAGYLPFGLECWYAARLVNRTGVDH